MRTLQIRENDEELAREKIARFINEAINVMESTADCSEPAEEPPAHTAQRPASIQ